MKNIRPFILLLVCTVSLRAASPPAGKTQSLTSPDQVPEGLAKPDWQSIRAAYEAGRHAFQPTETGWQARNPGQQWTTQFDKRGFIAQPKVGGWTWGMELQSYGFGEKQQAVGGVPTVKADGQRLSYQWDATVLNYSGLKVWDADGKILPSRFEPAGLSGFRLLVDESSARYTITIDPGAQPAYLKASQVNGSDEFGYSVAVSGDTVVVGAFGEDSSTTGVNSTPNEGARAAGATYIFTGLGPPPTVTLSTANRLTTAATLTITGTNFSTTPGESTVVFTPAGSGTVTASTATTLTVTSLSGCSTEPFCAVAFSIQSQPACTL